MPKDRSRFFSIYRPDSQTAIDASTSQGITDAIVPAKCPKPSSDANSPTIPKQLHKLTTPVGQLRITSEPALEQTKPLIRTFPLANMEQSQYLHAFQ